MYGHGLIEQLVAIQNLYNFQATISVNEVEAFENSKS